MKQITNSERYFVNAKTPSPQITLCPTAPLRQKSHLAINTFPTLSYIPARILQ